VVTKVLEEHIASLKMKVVCSSEMTVTTYKTKSIAAQKTTINME
jgi:hypothetical protein